MSGKTYTLIVRSQLHAGKSHTTLLTALTPEEGLHFYDVYANAKSLIWVKLINEKHGSVWKEAVGEVEA